MIKNFSDHAANERTYLSFISIAAHPQTSAA